MATSATTLLSWLKEEELKTNEELYRLSQEIWTQPELRFQEHTAHQLLTDFLEKKGFEVQRNYVLPTAFRAELNLSSDGASDGPNLCLLCEYDALPEIGHACGHNLIAEVGVAAALALQHAFSTLRSQGENVVGKLVVLGTPAEEGGGGKIHLLNAGAFEGMDAVLMAHPYNGTNFHAPHTVITSLEVEVTYKGRAAHSAVHPWQGLNALDAAVICYTSVGLLKQQLLPDWKANGVIKNGGEAPNVVPQESMLHYFLRAPTSRECDDLLYRFRKCVMGAADATGCQAEFNIKWDTHYKEIILNKAIADIFGKHSETLGVDYCPLKSLKGSTDFGNVSQVLPGIHPVFGIGTGTFPHMAGFTALTGSREAQEPTLRVAAAIAATCADLIREPELLRAAQLQHRVAMETTGEELCCLLNLPPA